MKKSSKKMPISFLISFSLFALSNFNAFSQKRDLKIIYTDPIYIEDVIDQNKDTAYVLRRFDKLDGKIIAFYDSSFKRKALECDIEKGIKNGKYLTWYRDGSPKLVENFLQGLSDGYTAQWNIIGVKVFEGNFSKGIEDGYFRNWYGNGVLKHVRFYNMGLLDGLESEFYINGRKKSTQFFNSNFGEKDGTDSAWFENGNIGHEKQYFLGLPHGTHTLYYENGGKKFQITYKNGKRDGMISSWEPDGKLTQQITYKNDFPIKEETSYSNGKKRREVFFKENSELPESWTYWDMNGNIINRKDAIKFEFDWDFTKSSQDSKGNSLKTIAH